MTVVVTGSGRSGTHWLAHVLGQFVEAHHEPLTIHGDVVVDCRRAGAVKALQREGHHVMHLIRDGRDVVRSQITAYAGRIPFDVACERWAAIVDACSDAPTVRLKDLLARQDPSKQHVLPHWTEWPDEHTETFWRLCGAQMERFGYGRES